MKAPPKPIRAIGSGVIQAGSLLTLEAIKRELSLSASALREARRDGLRVHRVGKRGFILADDLVTWIRRKTESNDSVNHTH